MDQPPNSEYQQDLEHRIPTLQDLENQKNRTKEKNYIKFNVLRTMNRPNYFMYRNFDSRNEIRSQKKDSRLYNYCILSVALSFVLGMIIGIIIVSSTQGNIVNDSRIVKNETKKLIRSLNSYNKLVKEDAVDEKNSKFHTVSFTGETNKKYSKKDIYPKGLTEDMKDILKDKKPSQKHVITKINKTNFVVGERTVLFDNVFWGPEIENYMPQGYGENIADLWERYVNQSEVEKMEIGCGRMQNRLVTFKDGVQACVRYRQNTDQIQGEIFSFYVAKLLNLTNLAPSVVKIVDIKDKLWRNVANDIAAAQWNTNRAVILTQFVPSLESATIPEVFKPTNRHLNKFDILKISLKENESDENSKKILLDKIKAKNVKTKTEVENFDHIDMALNKKTIDLFVELAQWSDLIIFDYLTANLDRIVNNLFNFQWNVNIMDGPAHNLAKKMDSGLLVFLDNESGLLHGYRLLKKYNVYHSLMLDNLCVFRKKTVDALRNMYNTSIGAKLSDMFHTKNNAIIRDILPPLPEKNAKILHERIGKVLSQVEKCEQTFR